MAETESTTPQAATISLWWPILYISVLLSALIVFSKRYRQLKRNKLAATTQFYEHNFARDLYEELTDTQAKPPKKLVVATLLAWGVEDFTRVLKFKENEPIMNELLQSGMIGDDFYERFTGSMALNEREFGSLSLEFQKMGYPFERGLESFREITQQHAMRRRLNQLDTFKDDYKELLAGREPRDITELLAR